MKCLIISLCVTATLFINLALPAPSPKAGGTTQATCARDTADTASAAYCLDLPKVLQRGSLGPTFLHPIRLILLI